MTADLVRAQGLSKLEQELNGNITKLNTIDRASFEEKERQLNKLGEDLPGWEKEYRDLIGSQRKGEVDRLKTAFETAKRDEEAALKSFERVKQEVGDISIHAKRLNEWRMDITMRFPATDVSAREFHEAESEAKAAAGVNWSNLVAGRRELGLVHRKFRDDPNPENPSNKPWEAFLDQIQSANIPEYEEKSKVERARWEKLFRICAVYGTDAATMTREAPGMSAFALEDGVVHHTYSAYVRGWTAFGTCTSGSTARRKAGTRQWCKAWVTFTAPTGTAATTNTTKARRKAAAPEHPADMTADQLQYDYLWPLKVINLTTNQNLTN